MNDLVEDFVRFPVKSMYGTQRFGTIRLPISQGLTLERAASLVGHNSYILDARRLPYNLGGLPLDALHLCALLQWCTYERFGLWYLINSLSGHCVAFIGGFAGTLNIPFYSVVSTYVDD